MSDIEDSPLNSHAPKNDGASSSSSSSSDSVIYDDDSSPESPKSPKSFALAALSALSTSFSTFPQPVFRTTSHSSLSTQQLTSGSGFNGLPSVSASPSLPSFSDRQPFGQTNGASAYGNSGTSSLLPTPSPEVQKLTHLSTLSQLICHLAQQSTHRKQDYATMLQFLRMVSSCDPNLVSRQGITVWSVDSAELIPPGVGSWMLVRGSERAVMKIGIGPNPGLKKYYWRDGSSKRFYKRETEGGVQDMSLVYIIQKAAAASKRCVSIPGSDLWLILYLRATPPGSQASATPTSNKTPPGLPFLTQSQESIPEILLSLQKTSASTQKTTAKRTPAEKSDAVEMHPRHSKVARKNHANNHPRTPEHDSHSLSVLSPFSSSSSSSSDSSPPSISPPLPQPARAIPQASDRVVQSLVDAYNNQDLSAIMSIFHESIEISVNCNEKIVGLEAVRARYQQIFNTHSHRSTVLHRTVMGRRVVDHEWISVSSEPAEVIAIYDVENETITKVWIFPYLGYDDSS